VTELEDVRDRLRAYMREIDTEGPPSDYDRGYIAGLGTALAMLTEALGEES
jgi:hypothetical protein